MDVVYRFAAAEVRYVKVSPLEAFTLYIITELFDYGIKLLSPVIHNEKSKKQKLKQ